MFIDHYIILSSVLHFLETSILIDFSQTVHSPLVSGAYGWYNEKTRKGRFPAVFLRKLGDRMRMRKKAWARPELAQCPYYIQDPKKLRGSWNEWFTRKQPLHLELGCGKGVFTAEIAVANPEINYLGIDLSDDVLGVARRNIESVFAQGGRTPDNIALTAYHIEWIGDILSEQDVVDRIYINFCNPWPKAKHHKKRLTHTLQLDKYKKFLAPGGEIHFKTDNDELFLATQRYLRESGFEILWMTKDLKAEPDAVDIPTEHEILFSSQGIAIKAIIAALPKQAVKEGNSSDTARESD